jgi:putative N-acetyltransferase (TIGR04045 family)
VILERVRPFRCTDVGFKLATEAWELVAYFALRRRIFCDEQRLFTADDRDAIDEQAIPIVAVARTAGIPDEIAGVVRIWEPSPGEWNGGRLGTHPDHRRSGKVGAGLIHLAVGTACGRGCLRFRAMVQERNVRLFERLGWGVVERTVLLGVPHARMEADLARYRGAA